MQERAKEFKEAFKDAKVERSEAQEYWIGFFKIFGIEKRRTKITFEYAINKIDGNKGFIDCFWPGLLIIEHKSLGKNLNMAYEQLLDYTWSLSASQTPRYAIVSDFQRIQLIDFDEKTKIEFSLSELDKHIPDFHFIYEKSDIKREPQKELKIKASKLMAKLHDALKENNYPEEDLEQFLTRLLFCLYAEDTGIFNKFQFRDYIFGRTNDDLIKAETNFERTGEKIIHLFRTLDKAPEDRETYLPSVLMDFPYVNGNLFARKLDTPSFNRKMFNDLKEACDFNWADISPAIFGSLFQYVIDEEVRREQGAHYTDESNVMKVVNSLFLNNLWKEFNSAGNNIHKLTALRDKLGKLRFLDPACGCGNFLIIAYRELRLLELEILKKILYGGTSQRRLSSDKISLIRIENFYGIEISDSAVNIAKIAMWFIEHQMNLKFDSINYHESNLPLKSEANIVKGNALRIDWADILPPSNNVYVLGNPPFAGKKYQTKEQKEDLKLIFKGFKNYASLDYVTAWYKKALDYIEDTCIEVAFVSTNSICQGEHVSILWKQLLMRYKFYINFAHQTFRWSNEAERNAGVYVVIIGFSLMERTEKFIYTYETVSSTSEKMKAKFINGYLIDSEVMFINRRNNPISDVPKMKTGSRFSDGSNLILSKTERLNFIHDNPNCEKFIRPYIGGKDFFDGEEKYCLWLDDITPNELHSMPMVNKRVSEVREFRLSQDSEAMLKCANKPAIPQTIRQPNEDFIFIPQLSSGDRDYIPMAIFNKNIVIPDPMFFIEPADEFLLAVLSSKMHMVWVDLAGGKFKGDYRYSSVLIYNTFPFPKDVADNKRKNVIDKLNHLISIRDDYCKSTSLAKLYKKGDMPHKLISAHEELDKAVDKCYRSKKFKDDGDRMKFLFDLYLEYTG